MQSNEARSAHEQILIPKFSNPAALEVALNKNREDGNEYNHHKERIYSSKEKIMAKTYKDSIKNTAHGIIQQQG